MAKANNYIDNAVFFEAMCNWKTEIKEAEEVDEARPPVSNYIGECFVKIAEHLSYKPNFANYPFREEMVGDAIENCITYAHNFDPEKSKNPFSYFTQITYYAFIRRIEKEKKQNFIKFKMMEQLDTDGSMSSWFKHNYFEKTDTKKAMANYFSLSDNDLEKFTTKKKPK